MTSEVPPAAPEPAIPAAPEAAAAPEVLAPVVPTATEAPPPAPPDHRRRDRALGTAGQVVGIVGIVVCLILAVGVVLGRGWAVGTVDDVAAAVDLQIAKAGPLLDTAHTTVGQVSGRVSTVADLAAGIAANPSPGGEIAQGLRAAIAGLNERYQNLRQGYADVHETVVSLIDRLRTLERILPGFSIPQGPVDALAAFDTRIREFDAKVNDLLTIDPGQGPLNQAAAKISDAAAGIDTKLQGVNDSISQVQERVTKLRADIASTAATINLLITLASIAFVLLFLYVAFLHWILFRHSGEIRQRASAG